MLETIELSEKELVEKTYNTYFKEASLNINIIQSFSGLRLLIKSAEIPNKVTRECALQANKQVISIFGGKWTTSRKLAKKVVGLVH